jgi:hypothetical protein
MQLNALALTLDSDLPPTNPERQLETIPSGSLERRVVEIGTQRVNQIVGAFWTSGQRQAANLHEVSYRACFKPQLPAYFIKRFSKLGDWIYDPFAGRGTTAIEAALWGRNVVANDANPLSAFLTKPRLAVPCLVAVEERLRCIPIVPHLRAEIDLSMFYHPDTEAELVSFRHYLKTRHESGVEDALDGWIRMVATNRLTGHSPGFFSVYTFPPNQAVSQESQVKINLKRAQVPGYRDTKAIILKKSRQLLRGLTSEQIGHLHAAAQQARFLTGDARTTPEIPDASIQLTVTSPPFLDIVQYAEDNWLRCWFNSLSTDQIASHITMVRTVERWSGVMGRVFTELFRVTKPGGFVAFEVGEVRNGKVKLEEAVVPLGVAAGFRCEAILINAQQFTKTANIWGVVNNHAGTNSNRIVLFHK